MNKKIISLVFSSLLFGVFWMSIVKADAEVVKADPNGCFAVKTYKDEKCGVRSIPDHDWIRLKEGDCAKLIIRAKSRWNASNLKLEKGVKYMFETGEDSTWSDASIEAGVYGWTPVALGAKEFKGNVTAVPMGAPKRAFVSSLSHCRRAPDEHWFRLIGLVADKCSEHHPLPITFQEDDRTEGDNKNISPADGQFCSYANDHSWFYWNNSGSLELIIKRPIED